ARRGQAVTLAPRRVVVYGIDLIAFAWPRLEIEVRCGKGTYIRSLARDLGERLGCGALVETLRRTRVGPFQAADGLTVQAGVVDLKSKLRPSAEAIALLPNCVVSPDAATRIRQGQSLPPNAIDRPPTAELAASTADGELAAILSWNADRLQWVPSRVFAVAD